MQHSPKGSGIRQEQYISLPDKYIYIRLKIKPNGFIIRF
jgi:hypothetical protein